MFCLSSTHTETDTLAQLQTIHLYRSTHKLACAHTHTHTHTHTHSLSHTHIHTHSLSHTHTYTHRTALNTVKSASRTSLIRLATPTTPMWLSWRTTLSQHSNLTQRDPLRYLTVHSTGSPTIKSLIWLPFFGRQCIYTDLSCLID